MDWFGHLDTNPDEVHLDPHNFLTFMCFFVGASTGAMAAKALQSSV